MSDKTHAGQSSGPATDRSNTPVEDPTENVLALVAAANRRADDLRELESRAIRELIERDREHIREITNIRAEYTARLEAAEAKRIDAIRLVDVQAVAVAADRAAAQAGVLATQVSTSAEAQRDLVAKSAAALAEQLTQIIKPITDRLAVVERASYEGAGKERATDPVTAQMSADIRAMLAAMSQGSGAKQGALDTRALLFGFVSLFVLVAGVIVAIIGLTAGG